MAILTTQTYVSGINSNRGVQCTELNTNDDNDPSYKQLLLQLGTSAIAGNAWDLIIEIDLSGLPNGITINSAILTLEVSSASPAGTAAELSVDVIRLIAGLDFDIETMTENAYDGLNPWPLTKYDRGITLIEAMPTSTGAWTIIDLKPLVDDTLRLGENTLFVALRRTQRGANHKALTIHSGLALDVTDRPTLVITHGIPPTPDTVIKGNRLTVAKTIFPRRKRRRQEGQHDLDGQKLYIAADGTSYIVDNTGDIDLFIADAIQAKLTSTGLSGLGTKRLSGWAGMLCAFPCGWNTTNTASNRLQYAPGLAIPTVPYGYVMPWAGSVRAMSMTIDINVISGADCFARLRRDSTDWSDGPQVNIATPIVANGQQAHAVWAQGVYTFVAGTSLMGERRKSTGTFTTDDTIILFIVEFDSF